MRALLALVLVFSIIRPVAAQPVAGQVNVGFPALPRVVGNPFASAGVFNLYVYSALFDGLTQVTREGTARPGIAASWQASEDTTRWTFALREDVQFSDGTPVTAATVVFAVDYLTSEAGKVEPAAPAFAHVTGAEAVDDFTVAISLSRPDPVFDRLASILFLVPPALWTELGREDFARAPVGTGPFRLDRLSPSEAVLEAVSDSWRKPAALRLVLKEIPDATRRTQALATGELDLAFNLSFEAAARLRRGGMEIAVAPSGSVLALPFVTTAENRPVADLRVREALNLAIDREAINQALLGGSVALATQTAARIAFGYNPDLAAPAHDPERARALLVEAGHGEGLSLTAEVVTGTFPSDALIYQQIVADLARVGVTLAVRPIPIQALIRNVLAGGWEGDLISVNYGTEPTFDALRPFELHSCTGQVPWYCNTEIQALHDAALAETDPGLREAATQQVMAAFRDDWPALFLFEVVRLIAVAPSLDGFTEAHGFVPWEAVAVRADGDPSGN